MIILDVDQGSMDWKAVRLGIPTTSRFDSIITPTTRKYSKGARKYIAELVAEWVLGMPIDGDSTAWMDRGVDMEPEARAWYEFRHDVEVREAGFVLSDDRRYGCSPDGLVGDDGGVEIKCFGPRHHVECLLGDDEPAKMTQVQGSLWVCERDWWDVVGYNPGFPQYERRIHRDEAYIADLAAAMDQFLDELEQAKERVSGMGAAGGAEGTLERLLRDSLEVP